MNKFKQKKMNGFTLTELMVTILIAAVLVSVAIPSFRNLYFSNQATTSANKMLGGIKAARIAAVKRNRTVAFCEQTGVTTSLANACNASTTWTQWGVVGLEDDGTASLLLDKTLSSSNILIKNATQINFGGDGIGVAAGGTTPFAGIVADIYTDDLDTDNHRCIAMVGGSSIRIYSKTGDCP